MVSLVGAQACPQAPKAVAQTCSVKKVFLEISQNSQENTCARASLLIKLQAFSFSVQRVRSYFREKEISSFPIIQERSYSTAIFLERPSFQDVRKKKVWFIVQCIFSCISVSQISFKLFCSGDKRLLSEFLRK